MSRLYTPRTFFKPAKNASRSSWNFARFLIETRTLPLCALFFAHMKMQVCVCVCACLRACLLACLPACLPACLLGVGFCVCLVWFGLVRCSLVCGSLCSLPEFEEYRTWRLERVAQRPIALLVSFICIPARKLREGKPYLDIGVRFRRAWLKIDGTGLGGFRPSIFPKGHL